MEWTWDDRKAEVNYPKRRDGQTVSYIGLEWLAQRAYATRMQSAQALVETIAALPPAQRAEVFQFVAFVAARGREAMFTREASAISAPSFAAVWDNSDDAIYDGI